MTGPTSKEVTPTAVYAADCMTAKFAHIEGLFDALQRKDSTPNASSSIDFSEVLKRLPERKLQRNTSRAGALGVATIEGLRRKLDFLTLGARDKDISLYVSSPAPYVSDKENYYAAISEARNNGANDSTETYAHEVAGLLSCPPMTGLFGLPNAVHCYGSIVLQARGCNGIFVSGRVGAHQAILAAHMRLQRRETRSAVVGGYATPSEEAFLAMNFGDSDPRRSLAADGAVFLGLARANDRSFGAGSLGDPKALILGGGGAFSGNLQDQSAFKKLFERALWQAETEKSQIDLIVPCFTSPEIEEALSGACHAFFPKNATPPIQGSVQLTGDLFEASGILEILVLRELNDLAMNKIGSPNASAKPYLTALIVNANDTGELSAIVAQSPAYSGKLTMQETSNMRRDDA